MDTERNGKVRFNPFKPDNLFASPACTVVGFLLIRRLPTVWDWAIPSANWIFAVLTLVLGFLAFRAQRMSRILFAGAVFCLFVQGVWFVYDSRFRAFISLEWPMEVPSNEAVIGGSLRNLNPADTVLKIYVCVVTAAREACYLDQHADAPSIRERYWHGPVRFGNERPENDHGNPKFFVVVAAVTVSQVSQLPGIAQPPPNNAPKLLNQLSELRPRAVAGPFFVSKTYIHDSKFQFTAIKEQNPPNPPRSIPIPPLRAANYPICPPAVITWKGPPEEGQAAAAVEAWQDGRPHGSAESALSYRIDKWPENVERIEVKISSAPRKGPYDSVWLKLGACQ